MYQIIVVSGKQTKRYAEIRRHLAVSGKTNSKLPMKMWIYPYRISTVRVSWKNPRKKVSTILSVTELLPTPNFLFGDLCSSNIKDHTRTGIRQPNA